MSRTILCYAEIFDVIFGGQKKSRHFRPARKNYLFFTIATLQCIRWVTGHTNYLGLSYAQPSAIVLPTFIYTREVGIALTFTQNCFHLSSRRGAEATDILAKLRDLRLALDNTMRSFYTDSTSAVTTYGYACV